MPVMKENDRRQNSGLPFVGGRAESSSIEPVDCVEGGSADIVILEVENFEVILREWVRVMVGITRTGGKLRRSRSWRITRVLHSLSL